MLVLSVHLPFYHTNVVLSGDFSVSVSLTETEKLSLEGTFCHVNVSVMLVGVTKCTPSFYHTNVVLNGDFSVYVSLTETETLSLKAPLCPKIATRMIQCYQ